MDPHGPEHPPHAPPPSLWPVGFAVGVAILLLGLIVGWHIVLLGAILTLAFGFLWVRDLTAGARAEPLPEVEPERRTRRAAGAESPAEGRAGMPLTSEEELATYPRSRFLEAATLGLGAVIGGVITVPVLAAAGGPSFSGGEGEDIDLGPVDEFPEGEWRIATFLSRPDEGEVSRRTAYVRYNGEANGLPSYTILSNRCVHPASPPQPNGPVEDESSNEIESETGGTVTLIPTAPAGFGCPCHGGQYDTEGNRTAGPPVRALDRYAFRIENDRLVLLRPYSVGSVEGEGAEATISKYAQMTPGVHVDGPSALLYPVPAPK